MVKQLFSRYKSDKLYTFLPFTLSNESLAIGYVGGVLIGITLGDIWVKSEKKSYYENYIKGVRLYHSAFAIPLLFVALLTAKPISMILFGIASGLIIHCSIKSKLKFYELTKESNSSLRSKGR